MPLLPDSETDTKVIAEKLAQGWTFTLPQGGMDRRLRGSIREVPLPATVTVAVKVERHRPPTRQRLHHRGRRAGRSEETVETRARLVRAAEFAGVLCVFGGPVLPS